MQKACRKCGLKKPKTTDHFSLVSGSATLFRSYCKPCMVQRALDYKAKNREKCQAAKRAWDAKNLVVNSAKAKDRKLKALGISLGEYRRLVAEQGGLCAICASPPHGRWRVLVADHDHRAGVVRGLLCNHCNMALGLFSDDPGRMRRAAEYVERTSEAVRG